MDAHEYVFVFRNLNILCIFSDRFFDPAFFRFQKLFAHILYMRFLKTI
jgi:hypothetical protein